ncbi:hypothetical protein XVE_2434, partial [Xanthomonas vesicatoria ATCC 35937]
MYFLRAALLPHWRHYMLRQTALAFALACSVATAAAQVPPPAATPVAPRPP